MCDAWSRMSIVELVLLAALSPGLCFHQSLVPSTRWRTEGLIRMIDMRCTPSTQEELGAARNISLFAVGLTLVSVAASLIATWKRKDAEDKAAALVPLRLASQDLGNTLNWQHFGQLNAFGQSHQTQGLDHGPLRGV